MLPTALLLATTLQAPPAPPPEDSSHAATQAAERAAQAAERAAQAAERAAEASARMAEAIERLAAAMERAPGTAAAAPTPPEPKQHAAKLDKAKQDEVPAWVGTVGLGLVSLTGNASTLTFNGLASAERKTKGWIYAAKAFGVYGRSRLPDGEPEEAQVVALSAGAQLRGDRRFTQQLSGYLLAGAETDHVKSVELRGFGEAGAGILWWDEKQEGGRSSMLRTDLAFRYLRETRFQYYPARLDLPDVSLGGPLLGVKLHYGLSPRVVFAEEAEVVPNVLGAARVLFTSRTKLLAGLTERLSLGATFLVQYDSAPAAGRVPTDTSLSVSVELAL